MNADDIPTTAQDAARQAVRTKLAGPMPAYLADGIADAALAAAWPAIEAHIRKQIAQGIEAVSLARLEEIDEDDRRPSDWERHEEWCNAAGIARRA